MNSGYSITVKENDGSGYLVFQNQRWTNTISKTGENTLVSSGITTKNYVINDRYSGEQFYVFCVYAY